MKGGIFSIVVLFFIISGCGKHEIIENIAEEKFYTSNIMGIVQNENNFPIEGAKVIFNGQSTQTDKNGVYLFASVQVSSRHNLIRIEKAGFLPGIRVFTTGEPALLRQFTVLIKKETGGATLGYGANIENGDYSIKIPTGSIFSESGNPYTSSGYITLHYFSYYFIGREHAPGNFVGYSLSNVPHKLRSFGMIYLDYRAQNESQLQIGNGQSITLSVKIHYDVLDEAPSKIPLWYFDYATGYWQEAGFALREGDKYVGTIKRFGLWGFNYGEPAVVVSGKVTYDDGARYNIPIYFSHLKSQCNHNPRDYTNYDGSFSTWIPNKSPNQLSFYTENAQVYKSGEFSPCQQNCNLGNINLSIYGTNQVTGKVIDCNNQPLKMGYVYRGSSSASPSAFVPVFDGIVFDNIFDTFFNGNNISYTTFDMETLERCNTYTFPLKLSKTLDLGTMVACKD